MRKKKVLITGGAGFIGSALVKHLSDRGYEVFVIDNLSFGNRGFIQVDDAHFFEEDILNRTAVFNITGKIKPAIVIHLAAIHFIPYCNQHPFESTNINIQGTINILDAVADIGGVEKIFFASTAAVYPVYDGATSETHTTGPMDIYGLSKLTGERLCNEFFHKTGIPTIICRFFNAFGPNETNPHLIPEIARQVNEGRRKIQLGNLAPKRDFIHTHDMAEAVTLLLEKFTGGIDIFNLGRGEEYSVEEIVTNFEKALGEKLIIEQDGTRVRKVERMHLLADNTKLRRFINWEPVISPVEGIKTLLQ